MTWKPGRLMLGTHVTPPATDSRYMYAVMRGYDTGVARGAWRALGLLERDATWGPQFGGDRLDMENLRTLFGEGGLAEVRAGLLRGDYLPAVGLLGGYSALQGGRRLERERR